MKIKKILLRSITAVLVISISAGALLVNRTKTQMRELFQMNKELQAENYYMAEFEFKLLGIGYHLAKGRYLQALAMMDTLHSELKNKEGLIKMPDFQSKQEELDFYLNLQNPRTGAFMDDRYPLNTYHGPTENVLLHLDVLAAETGQELKLKYPLTYLEHIDTEEALIATLNDWSTVNWLGAKLPQTSFHNARDILSLARDEVNYDPTQVQMVVQKHGFFRPSAEWKKALLQWFYDAQDPETGVWGPRFENGTLAKQDLNNVASIMKAFVDEEGNTIHTEFPLRYADQLFETILVTLDQPLPADDQLEQWHEWGLKTPKGIRTLTRYLWKDASPEHKARAKVLIEQYIETLFAKLYIPEDGSFSYYPNSDRASVDGAASGVFSLKEFGAFSEDKQKKLWNPTVSFESHSGAEFRQSDLTDWIAKHENINSIRVYQDLGDKSLFGKKPLTEDVAFVVYPRQTLVLDIMDSVPKMKNWLETTELTMGNWVSKAELKQELERTNIAEVPVYTDIPWAEIDAHLQQQGSLIAIGFDLLQVPRAQIVYEVTE